MSGTTTTRVPGTGVVPRRNSVAMRCRHDWLYTGGNWIAFARPFSPYSTLPIARPPLRDGQSAPRRRPSSTPGGRSSTVTSRGSGLLLVDTSSARATDSFHCAAADARSASDNQEVRASRLAARLRPDVSGTSGSRASSGRRASTARPRVRASNSRATSAAGVASRVASMDTAASTAESSAGTAVPVLNRGNSTATRAPSRTSRDALARPAARCAAGTSLPGPPGWTRSTAAQAPGTSACSSVARSESPTSGRVSCMSDRAWMTASAAPSAGQRSRIWGPRLEGATRISVSSAILLTGCGRRRAAARAAGFGRRVSSISAPACSLAASGSVSLAMTASRACRKSARSDTRTARAAAARTRGSAWASDAFHRSATRASADPSIRSTSVAGVGAMASRRSTRLTRSAASSAAEDGRAAQARANTVGPTNPVDHRRDIDPLIRV